MEYRGSVPLFRLVEVRSGETLVAKYEYDGLGRRVKAHIDTTEPYDGAIDVYRHFYYNSAWQLLETRTSTSENAEPETLQPECQYVWSARYIDSPILRDRNTDTDGLCDDERLYYATDANQNVTALTDTSGAAVERYVYDPYGKLTIYDGMWTNTRNTSSYSNAILYCGYYRDGETGLYHVRNRVYNTAIGGWVQRDPMGYVDGMSLYEYVGGNPGLGIDPFGLGLSDWGWGGWVDYTFVGTAVHVIYDATYVTAYGCFRTYNFLSKEMGDIAKRRETSLYNIPKGGRPPGSRDPIANDWESADEAIRTAIKTVPGTSITGPPVDPTSAADVGTSVGLTIITGAAEGFNEAKKKQEEGKGPRGALGVIGPAYRGDGVGGGTPVWGGPPRFDPNSAWVDKNGNVHWPPQPPPPPLESVEDWMKRIKGPQQGPPPPLIEGGPPTIDMDKPPC